MFFQFCHFSCVRITGKFPGYLSPSAGLKFADVPNGLAAISKVPAAGWGQILAYMAFCEVSQDQSPGTPAAAGDFGFKVLTSSDPAEKTKKLSAELANGRLAMMAIIGMFFQVGVNIKNQEMYQPVPVCVCVFFVFVCVCVCVCVCKLRFWMFRLPCKILQVCFFSCVLILLFP